MGRRSSYKDVVVELGKERASKGLDLVYGGESTKLLILRKVEIARYADCFIALPGGCEAMDALFEALSRAQLGIHDKPIGLLNFNGYFDNFLAFINNAIEYDFLKSSQRALIVQGTSTNMKLEEYKTIHEGVLPKSLWEARGPSSHQKDLP
ncbi:cytokinin riboside 5'-monophosphate phosphoribohydrolase LOG4-like [Malania oleifera]|uniref:cytokinin riboside 5'-monophosphate phosphoribohydrolase LOG4-like n=1 Tax=Malania oleifera TaxID=397392 RepID=UPI0025AE74A8|nr:cytokinin riboside 5'-monophosphate phosphoribohydrolase LOG4-like [Malania oleifera]